MGFDYSNYKLEKDGMRVQVVKDRKSGKYGVLATDLSGRWLSEIRFRLDGFAVATVEAKAILGVYGDDEPEDSQWIFRQISKNFPVD